MNTADGSVSCGHGSVPWRQATRTPGAGKPYPPLLVTTSTRDDRVHPGHARKFVARLDELGYPVDYYENIEGGHGGASNNEQRAFMRALSFGFLWDKLSLWEQLGPA